VGGPHRCRWHYGWVAQGCLYDRSARLNTIGASVPLIAVMVELTSCTAHGTATPLSVECVDDVGGSCSGRRLCSFPFLIEAWDVDGNGKRDASMYLDHLNDPSLN
jgi:hypothetical protein